MGRRPGWDRRPNPRGHRAVRLTVESGTGTIDGPEREPERAGDRTEPVSGVHVTYRAPATRPTASTELRNHSLPFESGPQPSSSHAISAPTERLIFDIVAHEDAAFALEPEVHSFEGIFMNSVEDADPSDLIPIPIPQSPSPLPGSPPVLATPHVPNHAAMADFVHERMEWDASTFRGCRLEVTHPPMGSSILLRFRLPES